MLNTVDLTNLCFEGGGMKAIAFLGAIKSLEENGVLNRIKRVVGTSAGSLYAIAVASKMSYNDLNEIIYSANFESFKDCSYNYIGDIYRVINYYGACPGNVLYEWFGGILEKHCGNKDITFSDLFKKTGILLVITATNLNRMKCVYFSHETYPNVPIRLAARMSSSMPMIFKPIEFEGDMYVDGGVLNNFPFTYFETERQTNTIKTLAFKLLSSDEHMVNTGKKDLIEYDRKDIKNIRDYVSVITESIFIQMERNKEDRDYKNKESIGYIDRVVPIYTEDISSIDFSMPRDTMKLLEKKGYDSTNNKLYCKN
jgi:NTE family protein